MEKEKKQSEKFSLGSVSSIEDYLFRTEELNEYKKGNLNRARLEELEEAVGDLSSIEDFFLEEEKTLNDWNREHEEEVKKAITATS